MPKTVKILPKRQNFVKSGHAVVYNVAQYTYSYLSMEPSMCSSLLGVHPLHRSIPCVTLHSLSFFSFLAVSIIIRLFRLVTTGLARFDLLSLSLSLSHLYDHLLASIHRDMGIVEHRISMILYVFTIYQRLSLSSRILYS